MQGKMRKIAALPTLHKTKKVAAYARVSSGKDAMLHSLAAQVSYYSKLIQSHSDWEYAGVYSDEAMTGTKESRSGYQQMLEDCRNGKIDLILTKSISRFARNTVSLLQAVRELKAIGIDVYFEEQNIHSISSEGELMLTILASYAQEESRSASENQKWRIRKGFQNGELINLRFMFGYKISRNAIVPDPVTAPIVKEIFARTLDGESYMAIARDLNERKIRTALGNKWEAKTIKAVLLNEKYTGNALLQKSYVNNHIEKKHMKNTGELPMYYAEETHEAIIDKETFFKVKDIIEQRYIKAMTDRLPVTHTAYTGLIKCPKCGRNYRQQKNNGVSGYNCPTYIEKGKAVCHGKKIPETVLNSIVSELLGMDEFDEQTVRDNIKEIIVPEPNRLIFIFSDGSTAERVWKDRSRSESWTPEMREAARRKRLERGNSQCQE